MVSKAAWLFCFSPLLKFCVCLSILLSRWICPDYIKIKVPSHCQLQYWWYKYKETGIFIFSSLLLQNTFLWRSSQLLRAQRNLNLTRAHTFKWACFLKDYSLSFSPSCDWPLVRSRNKYASTGNLTLSASHCGAVKLWLILSNLPAQFMTWCRAFSAGYRGHTITLQCHGLSDCQDSRWIREALLCCCQAIFPH